MRSLGEMLRPDRCAFGLPDPEVDPELNQLGIEFRVVCEGPAGGSCTVTGRDAARVKRIEALSWEDGQNLINEYCGVPVSSRWCCRCGMHTRIWLLCDGSLLFSHDWEYYDGAHRVTFDRRTAEKLKQLWERVRTRNAVCRCPA